LTGRSNRCRPCQVSSPPPSQLPLPLPCSGRLAACCDNLGRVLLVDTAGTLVVGMLKGYRDAQVAWLVCHGGSGGGGGSLGGLGRISGQGLAVLGGSDCSLASLADGGGSSAAGSPRGSAADVAAVAQEQPPANGQQAAAAAPAQQAQQQEPQGWQQILVTMPPGEQWCRFGSLPAWPGWAACPAPPSWACCCTSRRGGTAAVPAAAHLCAGA
jgi:hypothetical protein